MEKGAFALIDCLGFKGIWKKYDPHKVVQKLKKIEGLVKSDLFPLRFKFIKTIFDGKHKVNISLLSDTIVISVLLDNEKGINEERHYNYLITAISLIIVDIIESFLLEEPYLSLRGCVSFGEHLCDGNFIIGEAVDEAAEQLNVAEGAFIWLLPNAKRAYDAYKKYTSVVISDENIPNIIKALKESDELGIKPESIDKKINEIGIQNTAKELLKIINIYSDIPFIIEDYPMPIKDKKLLKAHIINPIFHHHSNRIDLFEEKYKAIMKSDKTDIKTKRVNTLAFFSKAKKVSTEYHKNFEEIKQIKESFN